MTEIVDAPTRPTGRNYVGGEWVPAASGETYAKVNPDAPERGRRRVLVVERGRRRRGGRGGGGRVRRLGRAADGAARRAISTAAAAVARGARRADRAGHDDRDGQAAARGARRGGRAAQILRFAASEAFRSVGEHFEQAATGAQVSTRRRPVGVVALITPWNFPIAIPVWKLAPALIYGNTVVLKLAYEAPLTGLHIAEAFAEAELPAGVLNVLTGRGSTVGAALVRDPRVRAISFTGSVATGHVGARRGDDARQARAARARRPQPADRDGRRRPRPRRRGGVRRRVLVGRPEVHRDAAHLRAGRGLRRVPGEAARAHRPRQGRRSRSTPTSRSARS